GRKRGAGWRPRARLPAVRRRRQSFSDGLHSLATARNGASPISNRSPVPWPNGHSLGFSLQQFSEVLRIRDAAGKPYVLIGGQAVNYWAERLAAGLQTELG